MSPTVGAALKRELQARGFAEDANGYRAPQGTIAFSEDFLAQTEVGEFLDLMVTRREKLDRAVAQQGREAVRPAYEDVVIVIESLKKILRDPA